MFPTHRLRRMRRTENIRGLLQEASIRPDQLIYPLFVIPGSDKKQPVAPLSDVYKFSVDQVGREALEAAEVGIKAVLLFGQPDQKDEEASQSYGPAGTVHRAIRAIKQAVPDMVIITDVCLCGYTDQGQCGIVELGEVQNDATLEILQRMAVSHAQAGADMVAPSAMMDGQVMAIREALDDGHFDDVGIMAISVKYASAFALPWQGGALSDTRQDYQMDPANSDEALREIALDIEEGADVVAVKPSLAYLDVIRRGKETFQMPLAAYNTLGEVAMIKAAAQNGWVEEKKVVIESLNAMIRAGSNMVVTPYAKNVATWISAQS